MATLEYQPVADLSHPDLKPYVTLRRRKDLEQLNIFVAEGEKVVQRLLESDYPVVSLLITEEWLKRVEPMLAGRNETIQVFIAPRKAIEQITGYGCHQGIKAVGRIHKAATLEDVFRTPRPYNFVALDGLNNAENLGVIVRNAAALGVHAIIAGETSGSPFLTRAIRTSMGAIFKLPAVEVTHLVKTLGVLRQRGIRCLAAHPHTNQRRLSEADLRGDICVVLGSEGVGISPEVLAACDEHVVIPMQSDVDSLNVSNASAAFFYEIARQRGLA